MKRTRRQGDVCRLRPGSWNTVHTDRRMPIILSEFGVTPDEHNIHSSRTQVGNTYGRPVVPATTVSGSSLNCCHTTPAPSPPRRLDRGRHTPRSPCDHTATAETTAETRLAGARCPIRADDLRPADLPNSGEVAAPTPARRGRGPAVRARLRAGYDTGQLVTGLTPGKTSGDFCFRYWVYTVK